MKYEYGYLIKDLATGEIDIDSRHPISEQATKHPENELIDGFKWVKVKVTYEEVAD